MRKLIAAINWDLVLTWAYGAVCIMALALLAFEREIGRLLQ